MRKKAQSQASKVAKSKEKRGGHIYLRSTHARANPTRLGFDFDLTDAALYLLRSFRCLYLQLHSSGPDLAQRHLTAKNNEDDAER